MSKNPIDERLRLAELYRQMSDIELHGLASDFDGLTETAKDALGDEMQSRGLKGHEDTPDVAAFQPPITPNCCDVRQRDEGTDEEMDERPRDYTWKTLLCNCEDAAQAWQLREVLKRAGIESWLDCCAGRYGKADFGQDGIPIQVAADQLEEAKAIASQPIPQDVIDEYNDLENITEFELPSCPACHAEDPVLVNADPVNTWFCESCGKEWTEDEAVTA